MCGRQGIPSENLDNADLAITNQITRDGLENENACLLGMHVLALEENALLQIRLNNGERSVQAAWGRVAELETQVAMSASEGQDCFGVSRQVQYREATRS